MCLRGVETLNIAKKVRRKCFPTGLASGAIRSFHGRAPVCPVSRAIVGAHTRAEQRAFWEECMTTNAGIWIDHRKAVIVTVGGPGEEHRSVILSKVEKHPERAGDSPLRGRYEARQVPADDKRQRALTGELNDYYDSVFAAVRDVASLLICGPGEAKGELKKRLEILGLGGRIVAVETADKMTDRQMTAKTRQYFAPLSRGAA
jgi:hypothetical protein